MRPRFRLKTKVVLSISGMVALLVATLSGLYIAQFVRHRVREAYASGDFVCHEIFSVAKQSVETDLSHAALDPNDPDAVRTAIQQALQSDNGVNAVLESVVGYSPTVQDAAVVDTNGRVLVHTLPLLINKPAPGRPDFAALLKLDVIHLLEIVYGEQQVYEVRLPLQRAGLPFGDIRVGISTVFLKSTIEPQLRRVLIFCGISILASLLMAAGVSNLVLRPLAAISKRLDKMAADEVGTPVAPEPAPTGSDEYGVVTTKIDRIGRQIRDVKEVFSALKENLDQVMANLQDGLILFTRDAEVVMVSASAEEFVKHTRAEMMGRRVEELFTPATRVGQLVLDAFRLRHPLSQEEVETEQGRLVQLSLDFIEGKGERLGALLTMRDAESVRRIEGEIELSRRMAAIGRLTSGVAHEVKNPINAIVLHMEVLRQKLQVLDPATRRHMDIIDSEIQRLDRVVQTLVDFNKPVELRLVDTDLRRLLEDVVLLATPEAAQHGVTMQREIPAQALVAKLDADLVKQAMLNIMLNGIQAMAEGGTLTIAARREPGSIEVEVRDQGTGIPPEIQDKIFNLYFTTKKSGSGIGLAMSYRVMQLHNGSLAFETRQGQGTTFRLHFPTTEVPAPTTRSTAAVG